MIKETKKNGICGNCTLKLVTLAYKRAPWFCLLREPLKLGMRILSAIHHVDTSEYLVRTPACYSCIRFYKVALKEKSATFRFLHKCTNPFFDRVIETIVTEEERKQTREYAQAATRGNINKKDAETWMRNMKTGF